MNSDTYLKSEVPLGEVTKNIGMMFLNNRDNCGDMSAFAQKEDEKYHYYVRKVKFKNSNYNRLNKVKKEWRSIDV